MNVKVLTKNNASSMMDPDSEGWELRNDILKGISVRLSTYLMIGTLLSMVGLLIVFAPLAVVSFVEFQKGLNIPLLLIGLVLSTLAHEMIHLLSMPKSIEGKGQRYLLFHQMMPSVLYNGGMSIKRYSVMVLAPLFVLSVFYGVLYFFFPDPLIMNLLVINVLSSIFDVKLFFKVNVYKIKWNYDYVYSAKKGMYFKKAT